MYRSKSLLRPKRPSPDPTPKFRMPRRNHPLGTSRSRPSRRRNGRRKNPKARRSIRRRGSLHLLNKSQPARRRRNSRPQIHSPRPNNKKARPSIHKLHIGLRSKTFRRRSPSHINEPQQMRRGTELVNEKPGNPNGNAKSAQDQSDGPKSLLVS